MQCQISPTPVPVNAAPSLDPASFLIWTKRCRGRAQPSPPQARSSCRFLDLVKAILNNPHQACPLPLFCTWYGLIWAIWHSFWLLRIPTRYYSLDHSSPLQDPAHTNTNMCCLVQLQPGSHVHQQELQPSWEMPIVPLPIQLSAPDFVLTSRYWKY